MAENIYVSNDGDAVIDWEIEQTMSGCDAALFVLGDNPRNSRWLSQEAAQCGARTLPTIASQLPELAMNTLSKLTDGERDTVNWDEQTLARTLKCC